MPKAPLATVKERFTDKAGLIKAVQTLMTEELWLDRLNADKGLDSVSNSKLLHLHDVLSKVQSDYGSRTKLIDAIATKQQRDKDADFKESLSRYPTPRLFELLRGGKPAAQK